MDFIQHPAGVGFPAQEQGFIFINAVADGDRHKGLIFQQPVPEPLSQLLRAGAGHQGKSLDQLTVMPLKLFLPAVLIGLVKTLVLIPKNNVEAFHQPFPLFLAQGSELPFPHTSPWAHS